LVASPAPGPFNRAKISEQVAGGGKTNLKKSAAYIQYRKL
jgi:hypothetical protein